MIDCAVVGRHWTIWTLALTGLVEDVIDGCFVAGGTNDGRDLDVDVDGVEREDSVRRLVVGATSGAPHFGLNTVGLADGNTVRVLSEVRGVVPRFDPSFLARARGVEDDETGALIDFVASALRFGIGNAGNDSSSEGDRTMQ